MWEENKIGRSKWGEIEREKKREVIERVRDTKRY